MRGRNATAQCPLDAVEYVMPSHSATEHSTQCMVVELGTHHMFLSAATGDSHKGDAARLGTGDENIPCGHAHLDRSTLFGTTRWRLQAPMEDAPPVGTLQYGTFSTAPSPATCHNASDGHQGTCKDPAAHGNAPLDGRATLGNWAFQATAGGAALPRGQVTAPGSAMAASAASRRKTSDAHHETYDCEARPGCAPLERSTLLETKLHLTHDGFSRCLAPRGHAPPPSITAITQEPRTAITREPRRECAENAPRADGAGCQGAPQVASAEHVLFRAHGHTRQLCLPMSTTLGEVWHIAGCPMLPLKLGCTYLRHAERTLASHGVTSGATLELMGGLRGGAPALQSGYLEKLPLNQSIGKAFGLGWKRRWVALYHDRVEWSESASSVKLGDMELGSGTTVDFREQRLRVSGHQGQMLVLRGPDLHTWAEKIEQCVGPTLQRHGDAPQESPEDAKGSLSSLATLDADLIHALREGWIALINADWIRQQPPGSRMRPRQLLERWSGDGVRPLLSPEEAITAIGECKRCVGVLSHGWLLPGDCDPEGARMGVVKKALATLDYIKAMFWE